MVEKRQEFDVCDIHLRRDAVEKVGLTYEVKVDGWVGILDMCDECRDDLLQAFLATVEKYGQNPTKDGRRRLRGSNSGASPAPRFSPDAEGRHACDIYPCGQSFDSAQKLKRHQADHEAG